jgi:hypothetical protein
LRPLQSGGIGFAEGLFHLLKLLCNMEPIQNTLESRTRTGER